MVLQVLAILTALALLAVSSDWAVGLGRKLERRYPNGAYEPWLADMKLWQYWGQLAMHFAAVVIVLWGAA